MAASRLNFYDKQHVQRMFVQERQINMLFNLLIASIAPEMRKWRESGSDNVWVRNSGIEKRIDAYLIRFNKTLFDYIQKNQSDAWMSSVAKNDKFIEQYIKGMALSSVAKQGLFSRNLDALKALQNRVDNGLNLSKRIWLIGEQTKGHIELFLGSGIATGRSAEAIGRDFRQLLKNPDKRFHRIRDKNGKLVPSQPMKDYNPGRGIYRSSRMNALRVSATETNMGYRLSDHERWQQLDFVLGFEVKRSQNAEPCVICDALIGKYPKDFVFSGFHPFCICYAVPIVMNHDDFADYLLDDTIPADKYVQNIPSSANKFLVDNPRYLQGSYFGKMNENFFVGKRKNVSLQSTFASTDILNMKPTEVLSLVAVNESMSLIYKKNESYFKRGYKGIEAAPKDSTFFMSTNINEGKILVNFAEKDGFDAGTSLVNAIDKIKKGVKLSEHEEYAIEVLWHEVLHNKSKNTVILPDIKSVHGFPRAVAETVNQLVARNTYPDFLKKLGGKAEHQNWVLENGFGYKHTVSNLRKLISKLNINEDDFVKEANKLLMKDYTNFDKNTSDLIVRMSKAKGLKRKNQIKDVFLFIEHRDFDEKLKILD